MAFNTTTFTVKLYKNGTYVEDLTVTDVFPDNDRIDVLFPPSGLSNHYELKVTSPYVIITITEGALDFKVIPKERILSKVTPHLGTTTAGLTYTFVVANVKDSDTVELFHSENDTSLCSNIVSTESTVVTLTFATDTTLTCSLSMLLHKDVVYMEINGTKINCTGDSEAPESTEEECSLKITPPGPDTTFEAPEEILETDEKCVPILNHDSRTTHYIVKLDDK